MKYLLDTHLLLWAAAGTLPRSAKKYFAEGHELYYSPASIWEVVIKRSLGRSDFQIDPKAFHEGLRAAGYIELPVTGSHALAVSALPPIHKDPFDRMLLAQADSERIYLVTTDGNLAKYPSRVILV